MSLSPRPELDNAEEQPIGLPRLSVVLDLDETLVHTTFENDEMFAVKEAQHAAGIVPEFKEFKLTLDNGEQAYVTYRPGVEEFLEKACAEYDVSVFTAGARYYGRPCLEMMFPQLTRNARYRRDCTRRSGWWLKDLTVVNENLDRTVLVDNNLVSFATHPENGIPMRSFFGTDKQTDDTELTALLGLLKALEPFSDVRSILNKTFKIRDRLAAACLRQPSEVKSRRAYFF